MTRFVALSFAVFATPAAAHHEVVATATLLPLATWLGVIVPTVGAAVWAAWTSRRQK